MKQLFTLILFMLQLTASAQSTFEKGYIIKAAGDSLNGFIGYKGDVSSITSCVFKADLKSEKQVFSPEQVGKFQYENGRSFASKSISVANQPQRIFMEILFTGVVNLYQVRIASQDRYFIERDGVLQEMQNDRIQSTDPNGSQFYRNSKQYLGILSYYFKDAPTVVAKLSNVDFDRADIIKITQLYHETVAKDTEYNAYKRISLKPNYLLGIKPVIAVNHIIYEPSYLNYEKVDIRKNLSYGAGMSFQGNIPNLFQNLYGQVFVGYLKYNFEGKKYDVLDNSYNVNYKLDILRADISLLYKFKARTFTPFLQAGLPISCIISNDGFIAGPKDSRKFNTPELNNMKTLAGYRAGAGIEIELAKSRLLFAIDYEKLKSYTQFVFKHSGVNLQTGFLFPLSK